jgi:hypothetical protein
VRPRRRQRAARHAKSQVAQIDESAAFVLQFFVSSVLLLL